MVSSNFRLALKNASSTHVDAEGQFTLGVHAQRGYGSWVCVSQCVCYSTLTSRVFVRLTNDTTYLTGNEGKKF